MTMRTWISLGLIALCSGPALGQGRTGQGATLGGVAGAIAGGIIGHQNDETPEGALIGGAIGAIAGGLVGKAQDQEIARQQYYRNQVWQQQQAQLRRAVTMADVVQMTRSGVSDPLIMDHIHNNGVTHELTTHDIIDLHRNGVSEPVISAMQRATLGYATETIVHAPPPPTVVVRKEYVVPSYPRPTAVWRYPPRPPAYYHGWHPPRGWR